MASCPLEVKNIFVTSTNRDVTRFPYGNSYTLYLTTPIKDITSVELLYAGIPNTMYNLTNGSNVIGFSSQSSNTLVFNTLPEGFYSSATLSTTIYMATAYSANVSVGYIEAEGRFIFTRPTSFVMNVATQELASLMGFDFPCNVTATNSATTVYANNLAYSNLFFIKSQHVVDMNANEAVFLDIQELRTMYNECAPMGSPYDTTVNNTANRSFGMIPMDVSSGNIKQYSQQRDYTLEIHYPYPIQKLDRLTVNWVDKTGKLLSFNGAEDNTVVLRFYTLRKNLC